MTRHYRFFVNPALLAGLAAGERVSLTDSGLKHQVTKVLRLKVGASFTLLDGQGALCSAVLVDVTARSLELELTEVMSPTENLERTSLTVILSIIKPARFEWALEKLTEVGVDRVVPLLARRSGRHAFKRERLEAIIKEAAEQCERILLPHLGEPIALSELSMKDSFAMLLEERSKAPDMVQLLYNPSVSALIPKARDLAIFVGPEGGFDEEEKHLIINLGARQVSLGPTILRAETAALLAAGIAARACCAK